MAAHRILLLTFISPLQRWGSAQRSRFLIDALRQCGKVDVVVVNFHPPGEAHTARTDAELNDARVIELNVATRGLWGRPRLDLPSDYVTEAVASQVNLSTYDVIVSRYIKPALKIKLPAGTPVIVDFDDAVFQPPWRALTSLKMKVGALLRLFNDRIIVKSRLRAGGLNHQHYFFCRQAERDDYSWLPGSVLPNLPALPKRTGPPDFTPPTTPALMFVGLLDYLPNQDAVDWFLQDIWPRIRQSVPRARFLIVGAGSGDKLQTWAQQPSVEVLGFVDSLESAYAQATASVVPMRGGAGTNIKALEAYQYGRPVVATTHVLESYGDLFRADVDMFGAADAQSFAAQCVGLLQDPRKASEAAQQGHQRMAERLTPEHFNRAVLDAMSKVLGPR